MIFVCLSRFSSPKASFKYLRFKTSQSSSYLLVEKRSTQPHPHPPPPRPPSWFLSLLAPDLQLECWGHEKVLRVSWDPHTGEIYVCSECAGIKCYVTDSWWLTVSVCVRWSCWTAFLTRRCWMRSRRRMWRWHAVVLLLCGAAVRAPGTSRPSVNPGESLCSRACSNPPRRTCSSPWWAHCRSVPLRYDSHCSCNKRAVYIQWCKDVIIMLTSHATFFSTERMFYGRFSAAHIIKTLKEFNTIITKNAPFWLNDRFNYSMSGGFKLLRCLRFHITEQRLACVRYFMNSVYCYCISSHHVNHVTIATVVSWYIWLLVHGIYGYTVV